MILVTGATGFIGRHLLADLCMYQNMPVRALSRKNNSSGVNGNCAEYICGDISDPESLDFFIEPDATFVHLAHANLACPQDAIEATKVLVEKCAERRIKRFIHCSSISVYGRVGGLVDEATTCSPDGEYARAKLVIEQSLLDHVKGRFELIILRPSEVFGYGGLGLVSLTESLSKANTFFNYLRSSLYGNRHMHLVPVQVVVDALRFFIEDQRDYHTPETFIVSADDDPNNNFRDIEQLILAQLGLGNYAVPPLQLPRRMLEVILGVAGRSITDTQIVYSPRKLYSWGFVNRHSLGDSIAAFAKDLRKSSTERIVD